jgi:hypothetical protein
MVIVARPSMMAIRSSVSKQPKREVLRKETVARPRCSQRVKLQTSLRVSNAVAVFGVKRRFRTEICAFGRRGYMAAVDIFDVKVLDNPAPFTNPLQFEITYDVREPLKEGELC